ncbi:hypothetical protein BBJ28_00000740 [Nothophytophthora sp. Chile5]|nr:hypothetical protein BBJ28_00000740 [Nothophytophthora sp. Chile5]
MKFGKQLEVSANPEWRDYYVQYKRLKRLIKRVAFEVEKQQTKQLKLQQKIESSPEPRLQVVVDETHPLLKAVVDEVQMAKQQFWEVTDANLKIVNDFFVGKIVSLQRSVADFEIVLADEQTPTGHVHSRSRTHSQGGQDERFHHGFAALQEIYDTLVDLRTFVQINHSGFRKIVKKVGELRSAAHLMLICQDVQQRCLAMLVFITTLWVTEALPYFATALLVPPLVVFLNILNDKADPDTMLTASACHFHAAVFEWTDREVMSQLVNHTTVLIMGGYSISAAFAKCQIELYIAAFLQRRFKKRPNLFLLAIMLMGLFLSMWISNHTAPVLCVSVLLPIIRDFPTDSAYVKTLLIGLAFACNLGGMMTPISSLQNTLAVSFLEKAGYSISFGQWMAMACWLFLLWVLDPQDATYIPQIVYDQKQKISSLHVVVIALTLLTIFLWASFSVTSMTFGDLGIISLMFMATMALPFSSFPNINSLLVLDDHGQPYLEVKDFLRVGVTFSLVSMALIVTLGYGLIVAVLGYDIEPSPLILP